VLGLSRCVHWMGFFKVVSDQFYCSVRGTEIEASDY
jgi:hypothetical protein